MSDFPDSGFPGPLYRVCEDENCPDGYAFRAPFPEVPHWHFIKSDEEVSHGNPSP